MNNKEHTGNWNTGDWNTGSWNTGDWNTGSWNAGNWNTGNWNTGDLNTGNLNIGDWNTGDWNTGSWNTGDLNTTKPETVRLFNEDSGWELLGDNHSRLRDIILKYQKPLCEWISKSNMTEQEIKDNPTCETTQGYLKVNSDIRNDNNITDEDKKFLKSVPNFDAEILKECTGIDIESSKIKITIDGVDKFVNEDELETIKKIFCDKG